MERNFCPYCGKRVAGGGVHTCSPQSSLTANEQLRAELSAQAEQIKVAREAWNRFMDSHEECTDFDGFTAQIVSMDDYYEAQEALAKLGEQRWPE